VSVAQTEQAWRVTVPGALLEIELPPGLEVAAAPASGSDAYGVKEERTVLVASGAVELPARITCRVYRQEPKPADAGHKESE
jgi:hypothetical protein